MGPERLLLTRVMLRMEGMELPVPQEAGRLPLSMLLSRCSSCRYGHASGPSFDHLRGDTRYKVLEP